MRDCTTGVHDGILAISRTYDSVEVRVPTSLHALHRHVWLAEPLTSRTLPTAHRALRSRFGLSPAAKSKIHFA